MDTLRQYSAHIPFSDLVVKYVRNSYQNDPFRIALELFLLLFAVKYALSRRYKPDANDVVLTDAEVDELVKDWVPQGLVPAMNEREKKQLERIPVIHGYDMSYSG